jgi:blue copper oxidase
MLCRIEPLALVGFHPDGVAGDGKLPESLVSLPSLPESPPPVSQELVMQMYRDRYAKRILMETGFMAIVKSGTTDPTSEYMPAHKSSGQF